MPITRRTFLRYAAFGAPALLSGCASAANGAAPAVLGTAPLTIWSSTYAIDSAIARWRGENPRIRVTRSVYTPSELLQLLREIAQTGGNGPDLVISDADTIGMLHTTPFWRLSEQPMPGSTHLAAAIADCQDDQGRIYAIPLSVNPIGVWYDQRILSSGVEDAAPIAMSMLMGTSLQSMLSQVTTIARTVPEAPLLSSVVDDYVLPALLEARARREAIDDAALIQSAHTALSGHLASANLHYSGSWFLGLTHQRSAVVVGGRWMQQALQRAVDTPESNWRLASFGGQALAGPSLVAAVPALAPQSLQAHACALAFATDDALQQRIAEASQTVPALRSAQQYAAFTGNDAFCGGQAIGAEWARWADALTVQSVAAQTRLSAAEARQRVRAAFANS